MRSYLEIENCGECPFICYNGRYNICWLSTEDHKDITDLDKCIKIDNTNDVDSKCPLLFNGTEIRLTHKKEVELCNRKDKDEN